MLAASAAPCAGLQHCASPRSKYSSGVRPLPQRPHSRLVARASKTPQRPNDIDEAKEVTEKYGLEAGLFKAFTSKRKDGGDGAGAEQGSGGAATAKELLKRYGGAYLLTSISLSIISIVTFYLAIDNGVDVAALLAKVGIEVTQGTERAGTFALAYAAHKAASPIRFPPTVALTPLVAKALGKDVDGDAEGDA
ncbi:unnamed protein product [Pedinophyceae sp. YPF-701]|nr:unnamed protein product [Pedinophyceae sp. YPF-701]